MTQNTHHTHFHPSLNTTISCVVVPKDGVEIVQFRGLQYARIERRFARPELVTAADTARTTDGTQFGPQCPQTQFDIRNLLFIPKHYPEEKLEQDEFRCLNLTVTAPAHKPSRRLPVMIWIHGGSQVNSIPGPGSRCSDTPRVVSDSVKQNKPIIIVGINYRLSIFAFGDGKGERNLALQDQRCAIEWVYRYISDFGGDPNSITLVGESAGGVFIHALTIMGTHAKRAILQSGSLLLAPPAPHHRGAHMREALEDYLRKRCNKGLQDAPVDALVQALEHLQIKSVWLEITPELQDWQTKREDVDELMIGDCEFESILWLEGIRSMSTERIVQCFDRFQGDELDLLKSLYCIEQTLPKACKRGALDFINDFLFAQPCVAIARKWHSENRPVYQYVIDEANPWQPSVGAHHGVDLICLFGDYDLSKCPNFEKTSRELRKHWISFVNGEKPWNGLLCAFGPQGICEELSSDSFTNRRRWDHIQVLDRLRPRLGAVVGPLIVGRINLAV